MAFIPLAPVVRLLGHSLLLIRRGEPVRRVHLYPQLKATKDRMTCRWPSFRAPLRLGLEMVGDSQRPAASPVRPNGARGSTFHTGRVVANWAAGLKRRNFDLVVIVLTAFDKDARLDR